MSDPSPSSSSSNHQAAASSTLAITLLDNLYNRFTSNLTSRSWGPLVSLSRSTVVGLLKKLEVGQLEVRTASGVWKFGDPTLIRAKEAKRHSNGSAAGAAPTTTSNKTQQQTLTEQKSTAKIQANKPPHAILIVKDDAFWVRMFLGADLGFAESFMLGEVQTPDLGACFEVSGA